MVGEALKGAILVSYVMGKLGYSCNPEYDPSKPASRTDIIQASVLLSLVPFDRNRIQTCEMCCFLQAIKLGDAEKVKVFCRAVQYVSPVGSHIQPVAGVTPG